MTRLHGLSLRTFLLAATFCLTALPALAQRLPGGVTPTHYTLWFAPDLEKETFRGRETIARHAGGAGNDDHAARGRDHVRRGDDEGRGRHADRAR